MTNSEKLARWQGKCYHVSDWGQTICKYCGRTNDPRYFDFDSINPDYLNNDAAAMSLLDTLVNKGYEVRLEDHNDFKRRGWGFQIFDSINDGENSVEIECRPTRREAVVAAVLALIGKEDA